MAYAARADRKTFTPQNRLNFSRTEAFLALLKDALCA